MKCIFQFQRLWNFQDYCYQFLLTKIYIEENWVGSKPIDNSIYNDLDGVEISQQMDDLHGMLNNPNCHKLLPIVTPMHHEGVSQPLNNRALSLPKTLCLVPASCVRHECRMLGCSSSDVIFHRNVTNLWQIRITSHKVWTLTQ